MGVEEYLPTAPRAYTVRDSHSGWRCVFRRETHLGCTPGPRALLYYLPRDPVLQATGVRLARSSRTEWRASSANRLYSAQATNQMYTDS